jgi:predicted enzyme related to lactoylglutathione lyase
MAASTPRDERRRPVISGVHAIVFTPAVAEVRAFFRDVLDLPHVEAGGDWPIYALPPAELAVHPAALPGHEIYLMCDDLDATLASLEEHGVQVRRPVREEAWGLVSWIVLAEGTEIAIYQPKHPSPRPTRPPSLPPGDAGGSPG